MTPPWPTHHTPCYDVSGTILTCVATSAFSPGDRVYGRIAAAREGAAREYGNVLPLEVALVPKLLSSSSTAAIPMSALTAWQGLFEHGELAGKGGIVPRIDDNGEVIGGALGRGKRVLVLGAAGGVGLMAVQFGKLVGAYVVGTCSAGNGAFVRGYGADEVVDYHVTGLAEYVDGDGDGDGNGKFDLVLDCVGGESMMDGWNAVRPRGTYISVVPGFREPEGGKPETVRCKWFIMDSRGSELEAIGKFIDKGLVRGTVDSVWVIGDFEKAFERTAGGHARGKVVIRIA
ncbi:NAD(P)-binding protein, partial [Massarina eburnea CBS 473.64]